MASHSWLRMTLAREFFFSCAWPVYQTLDHDLVGARRADKDNRIRYPDPAIKVNDTVKINLTTGE